MKITVDKDYLREKCSLFIATPCFGNQLTMPYHTSIIGLNRVCSSLKLRAQHDLLGGDSLITRARNHLTDHFLASNCTHIMWLDADIEFDPMDVIYLLCMRKGVIGGPYPKKCIQWSVVKEAIKANPNISGEDIEKTVGEFVINLIPGTEKAALDELMSVFHIGTGFKLVERSVYLKMIESGIVPSYRPTRGEKIMYGSKDKLYDFYPAGIPYDGIRGALNALLQANKNYTDIEAWNKVVEMAQITYDRFEEQIYLSEDYWFCERWIKIGGEVLLAPWMRLNHLGLYKYQGNLPAIAKAVEGQVAEVEIA